MSCLGADLLNWKRCPWLRARKELTYISAKDDTYSAEKAIYQTLNGISATGKPLRKVLTRDTYAGRRCRTTKKHRSESVGAREAGKASYGAASSLQLASRHKRRNAPHVRERKQVTKNGPGYRAHHETARIEFASLPTAIGIGL